MKWKNKFAIEHFKSIKDHFGKPSVVSKQKGGIAIWLKNDLKGKKYYGFTNQFHEIVIRDELIDHNCPKPHIDFLYSSIIVPVKPSQINMLYSISGSVNYDPLKNMVTARCGGIGANIATLKLVTDLLLGNSVEYKKFGIKYHNLNSIHKNGSYGKLIGSISNNEHYVVLCRELFSNVKKLNKNKKKLNKNFWAKAFNYKNGKCNAPEKNQNGGDDKYFLKYCKYKKKYLNCK